MIFPEGISFGHVWVNAKQLAFFIRFIIDFKPPAVPLAHRFWFSLKGFPLVTFTETTSSCRF